MAQNNKKKNIEATEQEMSVANMLVWMNFLTKHDMPTAYILATYICYSI